MSLDNDHFCSLSDEKQALMIEFLKQNFIPTKSFNPQHTDYGLKQKFSRLQFYVTQNQFAEAMIKAGFSAKEKRDGYLMFNISQKSPFFEI